MPDSFSSSDRGMLKYLWIAFVVVFIDHITKWMAEASLELGGSSYKVVSHLDFTLAYNYGAAFSFLSGQGGWQRWLFVVLAVVISIAIILWMARLAKSDKWMATALSLVLGGAVGNGIDRLLHGKVIDFIDVYADWDVFFLSKWNDGFSHFATFNVADIAINLGAIILVSIILFANDED